MSTLPDFRGKGGRRPEGGFSSTNRNIEHTKSAILTFLNVEKSVFTKPGPRPTCRAELPKSWIGAPVLLGVVPGILNAAGLICKPP